MEMIILSQFKVVKNVRINTQQFGYRTMKQMFACVVKRHNLRCLSGDTIAEIVEPLSVGRVHLKNFFYRPLENKSVFA